MAIMRTLHRPETVETKHGLMKVTHEVYGYAITPFLVPPIKVHVYKGALDAAGRFQLLVDAHSTLEVGHEEFKQLLNPTARGKKAGDFRLSDVLDILNRRIDADDPA